MVMASIYASMHFLLQAPRTATVKEASFSDAETLHSASGIKSLDEEKQTEQAFLEVQFSTPPSSFSIKHPISNTILVSLDHLNEIEWSDAVSIPQDSPLELHVTATWVKGKDLGEIQHFIQLTLSPDGKDDSQTTLRSTGDIDAIATFYWTE